MKRDEFLGKEDLDSNNSAGKKIKSFTGPAQNDWVIKQQTSSDLDEQYSEYKKRMNILNSCYSKIDPLNPSIKLNTTYPLYPLQDNRGHYWCFNLITLWSKVSSFENYDLQRMQSHFGNDYMLTEIRTPVAIFPINIMNFIDIKKEFYNYAYKIQL